MLHLSLQIPTKSSTNFLKMTVCRGRAILISKKILGMGLFCAFDLLTQDGLMIPMFPHIHFSSRILLVPILYFHLSQHMRMAFQLWSLCLTYVKISVFLHGYFSFCPLFLSVTSPLFFMDISSSLFLSVTSHEEGIVYGFLSTFLSSCFGIHHLR